MKKSRLHWVHIILLIIISVQCNKKKDYREEYTGNYNFTVVLSPIDTTLADTTIHYSGQISMGTGTNDVYINYMPNYTINVWLSESGSLLKPQWESLSWLFTGKFESMNKVTFISSNLTGKYHRHDAIGIRE